MLFCLHAAYPFGGFGVTGGMKTTTILLVIVSVWAMVTPLAAHHSFSAEYDLNKPLYMDGKVTKVEWLNPHAFVFMNATSRTGGTENWQVEISPPTALV